MGWERVPRDDTTRQFVDGMRHDAQSSRTDAWTMATDDVRALLDAMARIGYDVPSLLAAADMQDAATDDPDARIACDAIGKMLGIAQQLRLTPNLALELARVTPLGAYASSTTPR